MRFAIYIYVRARLPSALTESLITILIAFYRCCCCCCLSLSGAQKESPRDARLWSCIYVVYTIYTLSRALLLQRVSLVVAGGYSIVYAFAPIAIGEVVYMCTWAREQISYIFFASSTVAFLSNICTTCIQLCLLELEFFFFIVFILINLTNFNCVVNAFYLLRREYIFFPPIF